MAKKKDAKTKPRKRIAGVKIPKALRKSGGSIASLAQAPLVREILAAGLVAAAAALAQDKRVQRNAGKAGKKARAAASQAADFATQLGQGIASAATNAAHNLYDGRRNGPAKTKGKRRKAEPQLAH